MSQTYSLHISALVSWDGREMTVQISKFHLMCFQVCPQLPSHHAHSWWFGRAIQIDSGWLDVVGILRNWFEGKYWLVYCLICKDISWVKP